MSLLTVNAEYNAYISVLGDSSLPQSNRTGKGYARFTPTSVTSFLSTPANGTALPVDARHAWIMVKDNPIRARSDGIAPSATEGLYIPAGTLIQVENQYQFLVNFQFINTAAGAAEVTAMWFA